MPYATRAQIEARLPTVKVASEQFDGTVAEALLWADSQVDVGLSARYTVPLASPVPAAVSQLAADFAAVFVLASSVETEEAAKAAGLKEAQARKQLEAMVKTGVPELETPPDADGPAGIAWHSGFGQTSKLQRAEW